MTNRELLDEAKRRYSIGTRFKSFCDHGRIREVQPYDHNSTVEYYISSNGFVRAENGMRTIGTDGKNCCSNPTVYENGKWAEIVLGETEEWKPKVGEWAYCANQGSMEYRDGKFIPVFKIEQIDDQAGEIYLRPEYGKCTGSNKINCRPARPEEIPQEKGEYVECIKEVDVNGGAIKGDIYPVKHNGRNKEIITKSGERICDLTSPIGYTNFKPSTREAYEAQEKKVRVIVDDEFLKYSEEILEKLNKCSTINTNQNECKNEKPKSIKVQGSNFSIGRSSQSGATGLRCDQSKITVGNGFRADSPRSIKC